MEDFISNYVQTSVYVQNIVKLNINKLLQICFTKVDTKNTVTIHKNSTSDFHHL